MKNPGRYILSLPGGKYVLWLLFTAASIGFGFGVGVVVGAEEAEAVEAAEAQRHRSTPSPFGVPAVSRRQLGPDTEGACCVANATDMCVRDTTRAECEGLGGYYAGDDFECGFFTGPVNNPYRISICEVGSCCVGSADAVECKKVSAWQCLVEGSLFSFVPGGNCSDDTDTCSRGACCTQQADRRFEVPTGCNNNAYKGRCEDVSDFGLNGTFLGEGTECGGEEDICGCQEGNKDICSVMDLPCGQECTYDFQCDSGCCFTREQLKFGAPNDPTCPNQGELLQGVQPNCTSLSPDIQCFYLWDCCCGKCGYKAECSCTTSGIFSCVSIDASDPSPCACPAPVGRCTESEWCECADQVQGLGDFRNFIGCVNQCPNKHIKKRGHVL